MGGVDLADQMANVYELDRKSCKWRKKVFFRLLMSTVVNSWIAYCELKKRKTPLLELIVPLAEALMSSGKLNAQYQRVEELDAHLKHHEAYSILVTICHFSLFLRNMEKESIVKKMNKDLHEYIGKLPRKEYLDGWSEDNWKE
ncbi:piggyBac transposable element-derived protein 4, partial [Trichonephila inaurata madagascariensis]